MLEDRKLDVLRAIVEDYVSTQEPVGSKALVERHNLGVSPATIRNDMASLEDEGYITQPHTSAGRIPTEKGYRLFVDRLSTVKPLSVPERRAIQTFLSGAVDLDDIMARTVRLLAQLTHQAAVVQYPSLSRSAVRHVELVPMTPSRLLVVLITTTGRVEQRVVDIGEEPSVELLADLRARINGACIGERIVDAVSQLADLVLMFEPVDRPLVSVVTSALMEAFTDQRSEERIAVGGTANLTRFGDDFDHSIRPMLEALEEHVVLMQLLGQATGGSTLTVRIGSEVPHQDLSRTAIVASGYGSDAMDPLGTLGVVGPTRMDYPGTMASVRAVARYVSQRLADG